MKFTRDPPAFFLLRSHHLAQQLPTCMLGRCQFSGSISLCNIAEDRKPAFATLNFYPLPRSFNLNYSPIFASMASVHNSTKLAFSQNTQEFWNVLSWPNIFERQLQEFFTRIAVVLNGLVVC